MTRTDRRRFPILLAAIAALLVFIAVDAVSRPVQAQTPAAELMGLSLDSGTLRPAFDSAVTEYRAAVKHNVSQITVTGTAATGVTVTYQDATGGALADADGDTAGHQVDLRVGETVFQVEAASGSDTETYTVTMERDASAFLGWTPSRDIDLDGENTDAVGMWSNDTTLWVADSEDAKLYAYTLATGTRDSGEDIDLHADNANPTGIWSDGTTLWVADDTDDKLYAYTLSTETRDSTRDITLDTDNANPSALWGNTTHIYVAENENADKTVYAYTIDTGDSGGDRASEKDIDAKWNGYTTAIWSDGTTLWTAEGDFSVVVAYSLETGMDTGRQFFLRSHDSGTATEGSSAMWSDGTTAWFKEDIADGKLYSYNLPSVAGDTTLSELSITYDSDTETALRPAFAVNEVSYQTAVPSSAGRVTVAATKSMDSSVLEFLGSDGKTLADADDVATGHQVDLGGGYTRIFLKVTSSSGDALTYVVGIGRDSPLIHGWTPTKDINGLFDDDVVSPTGIWSNETTMWVGSNSRKNLYAYTLATGARDSDRDIGLDDLGITGVESLWGNTTTIWVAGFGPGTLYAYKLDLNTDGTPGNDFGTRDSGKDISFDAGNSSRSGLWSDAETMWVVDIHDNKVYAYAMSDGARQADKEFDLGLLRANIGGIWSDGATMWVVDARTGSPLTAYKLDLNTDGSAGDDLGDRDPAKDIYTGVSGAKGLWSDGTTIWVASRSAQKVYSFNMAPKDEGATALTGLAVTYGSGEEAALRPGFAFDRGVYRAAVPNSADKVTVTPTRHTDASTVSYLDVIGASIPDADGDAEGQQVSADVGETPVLVQVTSGTDSLTYALTVERDSAEDWGWTPTRDYNDLTAGNERIRGMWSNADTLYVSHLLDSKIYAYDREDGSRDSLKDITLPTVEGSAEVLNQHSRGLWSDGTTLWVVDQVDEILYAYTLATGAHDSDKDIALMFPSRSGAIDVWSDGTTIWVSDTLDAILYAYELDLNDDGTTGADFGARDGDKDITLVSENSDPTGIWSDGETMWVADWFGQRAYAYALEGGTRKTDQEFELGAGPRALWSDGVSMWAMTSAGKKIYSYRMPNAAQADATLSALSLGTGVTLDPTFASDTYAYTASVANSVDEVTVAPTTTDSDATFEYLDSSDNTLADADTNTAGQQVDLDVGDTVFKVKVTAEDGTTTQTYTVTVTRACALNTGDIWCGVVTVGDVTNSGGDTVRHGFQGTTGGLSDETFSLMFETGTTNNYTITAIVVGATTATSEQLYFVTSSGLTNTEVESLALHVDGESDPFVWSDSTEVITGSYRWPARTDLDWSSETTVTLRLREFPRPTVTNVEVTSTPALETDTYGVDETIEVSVTFSEAVVATSDTDFVLSVAGAKRAPLLRGSGTATLVFGYTVVSSDDDDNGIWIGNETRTLDGNRGGEPQNGTITSVATGAAANLDHSELGTDSDHKVDGSRTTENVAPSFSSSATISVAENQTTVVTVLATDSDADDSVTGYAITGGADQTFFSIGATSGALTFDAAPNYEDADDSGTNNTYVVEVTATSGAGTRVKTATQTITVTVTDVAEQSAKPAKPVLAKVTGSTTSLTATWEAPGKNGGPAITGYKLEYRAAPAGTWMDFAHTGTGVTTTITGLTADTSYQARVRAENGETDSDWSDASDAVSTNAAAALPTLSIGNASATEGSLISFPLTLSAAASANVTVTCTASFETGDTAVAADLTALVWPTTIQAGSTTGQCGTLSVQDTTDEDDETFTVTLSNPSSNAQLATDPTAKGTILDDDDAANASPSFSSSATISVAENETTVVTVLATDSDADDDITGYAITGGPDQTFFSIGETSGALTFEAAPNHESPQDQFNNNTYVVDVTATSGTGTRVKTATQTITVTVTDLSGEAPGKPAKPRVSAASATSLRVNWSAPDNEGPPITDYDVRYRAGNSGGWSDASHTGKATTATLTGLTEDTSYQVQVRATNAEGTGAWSDSGSGTPAEEDDLPADTSTTGTVEVDGSAVKGDILAPDKKTVTWTDDDGDEVEGIVYDFDTDWFAVELEEGRTYRIDMKGQILSSPGLGTPGEPVDPDLTLPLPQINAIYNEDGEFLVNTFDSDESDSHHLFRVTFHAHDSGTHYIAASGESFEWGGYELTVIAITEDDGDDGDGTNVGKGLKNLRAVEEKGGVRLTWQPPDGAAVTGYRIERRRAGGQDSGPQRSHGQPGDHHTLVEDTGNTETSYVDESAEQGVEYEYRVTARNESGPCEESDWVRAGPEEEPVWGDGLPGAPRNLTATPGNREVSLSWDPPADNGNAPATRYRIEWRVDGQDYTRNDWGTAQETTYTTNDQANLANGVKYVFRVKAGNGSGNSYGPYGPASEEVSATPTSGSAVDLGTPVLSDTETLHHGMVKLDWQDIEDAGWYVVQYYHVEDEEWLDLPAEGVDIAFHGSSAVASNLHGLSWLRVGAASCDGASEWSQIEELYGTNASDWEGVPVPKVEEGDETEPCPVVLGTPVLSDTEILHHGMVQLDWQDIEDAGWYVVQYYHLEDEEWLDLPAEGVDIAFHGSSAVVSNLHGLSWLRVGAASCDGASEWSQIEELYGTNASDWEGVPVPEVAEGDEIEPCSEDADTPDNSPATGAPTISGTSQVGETLTANTSGVADADGLANATFSYQWLADDSDISGAVSAAPTPNSPATGAPAISGTAQVGETLTADTSGVTDADGLSNVQYEYQWLADDSEILGATNATYTLVAEDEGKAIKVQVSFTDDADNGETLTSVATGAVAGAQPTEPPAKPTGLEATATNDSVTLTWDDPGDNTITGYVILRRIPGVDPEGHFDVLVANTGTAATTYTDDTVLAETRYTYRIKAINGAGTSERSRWSHIDVPAAPVPDKPTGLEATESHGQVTLTWDDPGDDSITGYVILRRVRENDTGGDFSVLVADTGTAALTYTDDTVAAGTTYTYRIKAINEHGTSERSSWFHIDIPAAP